MRSIKFRGKSAINKKWCIGSLYQGKKFTRIVYQRRDADGMATIMEPVYVKTVQQWTGRRYNKRLVWEGDLFTSADSENIWEVIWNESIDGFSFRLHGSNVRAFVIPNTIARILDTHKAMNYCGNIIDNPEIVNKVTRND